MTLVERKKMIVNAIRKLQDQITIYSHCYDGIMSYEERQQRIRELQHHLVCAKDVLVMINEEELLEVA